MPPLFKHLGFLAAILLVGMPLELLAQRASVRGFVSDSTSREVLAGVNIALRPANGELIGAAADADGYFVINQVPPGTVALRVSFVGYQTVDDTLNLDPGEVRMLRIRMVPEETELGEIVVEAEAADGAAASVAGLQTMRPADIERVPIPGVTGDLVSYLTAMPGVATLGDRGGQFFIRGGSSTQNETLLDGIPLFQPFHILSFYSAYPSEVINEVNFYKGGFGAQYGGRLSSVIDVRARNGNKDRYSGALALSPLLSAIRVEGPIIPGRLSALVSVRESFIEQVMSGGVAGDLPYRLGDRFAKLHAFLTSSATLSVTGITTHDSGDMGAEPKTFLGDVISTVDYDSTEIRWGNKAIGAEFNLSPVSTPIKLRINASLFNYETEVGLDENPERRAEVDGYRAFADFVYYQGLTEWRAGVFSERRELAYQLGDAFQDFTSSTEDLDEAGGYAELSLATFRNLTIEPGLRLHAFPGRDQVYLEPRFRTMWYPKGRTGRHTVSGAVGIYHQGIIGLNDERDIGNVFTAWVPTPADADVQESIHAILGWEGLVHPLVSASVETFYRDFRNLLVPIFSPFPAFTTELQSAEGDAYGFDLRAELTGIQVDDWEIYGYAGYGFTQVEYVTETATYNPPHDRRHSVNILARARTGDLEFVAQWQYGSGLSYTQSVGFDVWIPFTGSDVDVTSQQGDTRVLFSDPYAERLPDYHRLDLWIEKSFRNKRYRASIRGGIINVYDRQNLFYFDLFTFRRIDQLPLTPSIGIKLEID